MSDPHNLYLDFNGAENFLKRCSAPFFVAVSCNEKLKNARKLLRSFSRKATMRFLLTKSL